MHTARRRGKYSKLLCCVLLGLACLLAYLTYTTTYSGTHNSTSTESSFEWVVEGNSMSPTIQDGDTISIEVSDKYCVGDVVIFSMMGQNYVKRIVAAPNSTISFIDGSLYVNGSIVLEDCNTLTSQYVNHEVILGNDEFYVIGDNSYDSIDSRVFGPVNLCDIIGKWKLGTSCSESFQLNDSGLEES